MFNVNQDSFTAIAVSFLCLTESLLLAVKHRLPVVGLLPPPPRCTVHVFPSGPRFTHLRCRATVWDGWGRRSAIPTPGYCTWEVRGHISVGNSYPTCHTLDWKQKTVKTTTSLLIKGCGFSFHNIQCGFCCCCGCFGIHTLVPMETCLSKLRNVNV